MTDDDKTRLAAAIAEVLNDAAHGMEADADLVARLIVDRIDPVLHQQAWMPPEIYGQVRDWATRLGEIPEHHVSRSVLNSHLSELAAIL